MIELTNVTELRVDVDEDTNDGEWPYPTEHVVFGIDGELANRIRERLDVSMSCPVTLTEHRVSSGWSEYTQEDYFEFTIAAGDVEQEFEASGGYYGSRSGVDGNLLNQLLAWLDDRP